MTYTYEITATDEGVVATCVEVGLEGTGRTLADAVSALQHALEERMASVDAVGPPSRPPQPSIHLRPATPEPARDPQGPGDSPAAERRSS